MEQQWSRSVVVAEELPPAAINTTDTSTVTADKDAELRKLAAHILATHMFIHIPKSGGTSIETVAKPYLTVITQLRDCCCTSKACPGGYKAAKGITRWKNSSCCGPGSPWHMAPDGKHLRGPPARARVRSLTTRLLLASRADRQGRNVEHRLRCAVA